jgi:hypothetical protein
MEEKITKKHIEEAVAYIFRDKPIGDRKIVLWGYCSGEDTVKRYSSESLLLCSDEECTNCGLIKNALYDVLSVFAKEAAPDISPKSDGGSETVNQKQRK